MKAYIFSCISETTKTKMTENAEKKPETVPETKVCSGFMVNSLLPENTMLSINKLPFKVFVIIVFTTSIITYTGTSCPYMSEGLKL